ncbi:MAG: DUF2959 domain-containing protein [Phycisphaeraceae bacterium]|nr:DUF2959 domain-containing protein [Phycisphaeraceae bacterium]
MCVVPLAGCASQRIAIAEALGTPKREQLVSHVEKARNAQEDAKEQFADALEEFKALTGYSGGDLEAVYNKLKKEYERSQDRAEAVTDRINMVELVSSKLFKEWETELDEYSNQDLRRSSEQQLYDTKAKYTQMVSKMKQAESKMQPVLTTLGDQVLFLKHNLNARSIASLQSTVVSLETEVETLIRDMEASIAEANTFINEMSDSE